MRPGCVDELKSDSHGPEGPTSVDQLPRSRVSAKKNHRDSGQYDLKQIPMAARTLRIGRYIGQLNTS